MLADVAQGGGTQQGVADGVNRHVSVRMGDEPFGERNFDPSQHQLQAVGQRVHVVAVSYSEIHIRSF